MLKPEDYGFEGDIESYDYEKLRDLRTVLDIETELVSTVASFGALRIRRLTHELAEAKNAMSLATASINELIVDERNDFGPAYEAVKQRKEQALNALKKASK